MYQNKYQHLISLVDDDDVNYAVFVSFKLQQHHKTSHSSSFHRAGKKSRHDWGILQFLFGFIKNSKQWLNTE